MVTEGNACGAIPEIKRNLPLVVPAKSRGLPRPYGPRNDVFSFGAGSFCVPAQGRPQADRPTVIAVPRIRRGAVGVFVCPAERSMPVPCEEIPPNSKKEVTPRFVSR